MLVEEETPGSCSLPLQSIRIVPPALQGGAGDRPHIKSRESSFHMLILPLTLTAALHGGLVPTCFVVSSVMGSGLSEALSQLAKCQNCGSDFKFTVYVGQGRT